MRLPRPPWLRRGPGDGVVGILLQEQRVSLAAVRHREGEAPRVLAWASAELEPEADAAAALAGLVRRHRLRGMPCVLTLEPGSYALRQLERPPVGETELAEAARWRLRDLIDFPVEQAIVDAFEIPGLEARGRPPAIYAVAARRDELARQAAQVGATGLALQKINIAELALRNLAVLAAQAEESLAVVWLQASRGTLAVSRAGGLYVARALDAGAGQLTATGPGAAREELYGRVALEVQRTFDYFDSNFSQPPVRGIQLLADGDLGPFCDYLREGLGLAGSAGDAGELLPAPDGDPAGPRAPLVVAAAGALQEALL